MSLFRKATRMNPDIKQIAVLRKITYPEAEEFCRAVYRNFVGRVPPYRTIAQAVTMLPDESPQAIADRIKSSPVLQPPQHGRKTAVEPARKGRKTTYDRELDTLPFDTNSRFQKNRLRSKNRVEPEKARTCPHGVPFYRPCAICKPEAFD
jgi:hypothetical protein